MNTRIRHKVIWGSKAASGRLGEFRFIEAREQDGQPRLVYRARLGDSAFSLTYSLDAEGKIRGLRFRKDE